MNFWREFFAFRNPHWFLDARSHWEVKITARNPDNLVEFLQKFTAEHHPRWGVFNRVLAHAIKLQNFKKSVRFCRRFTFECVCIRYPDTRRAKITARNQNKIKNWLPKTTPGEAYLIGFLQTREIWNFQKKCKNREPLYVQASKGSSFWHPWTHQMGRT